ncbi:MAG: hypothetical protein ABIX01_15015 [Chitinophagaceae bacterium]
MNQKPSFKTIFYCLITCVVITGSMQVITSNAQPLPRADDISFNLKNNSLLPKKITLVSYRPYQGGNGTNGFILLCFTSRECKYPPGTKLYLAGSLQVDTVMSGNRLQDKPFLIVKVEDEGKTFNISD